MTATAVDISTGTWGLHPKVRLRPERFGALAYHYENRRLNFLRDAALVRVVEELSSYPDVDSALIDHVPAERHSAFRAALASLAASEFLVRC